MTVSSNDPEVQSVIDTASRHFTGIERMILQLPNAHAREAARHQLFLAHETFYLAVALAYGVRMNVSLEKPKS